MREKKIKEIEYLYRRDHYNLLRYAKIHVDREEIARELVQDTFHTAMDKWDILKDHPNQGGWLMDTLKIKIKQYKTKMQRDQELFVSWEENAFQLVTPFAEEALELKEVMAALDKKLSDEDKYLFKRIVFEDATHLEVAQELGITVWTSQKRLSRIREALKKEFPDRGK